MPRKPRGYYGMRRGAMRVGRGQRYSARRGAPLYMRGGCVPSGCGFLIGIVFVWGVFVSLITSVPNSADPYGPRLSTLFTWILLPAPIYVPLLIWILRRNAKKVNVRGDKFEEQTHASESNIQTYSSTEILGDNAVSGQVDDLGEHVSHTLKSLFPPEGQYILKRISIHPSDEQFNVEFIDNISGSKNSILLDKHVVLMRAVNSGRSTVIFRDGQAKCYVRIEDICMWGLHAN